jgi:hypothetical protein
MIFSVSILIAALPLVATTTAPLADGAIPPIEAISPIEGIVAAGTKLQLVRDGFEGT